ncbi:MAG: BamA/TamA family outer membrane protein, partial [Acidimicrobiales bacterium]
RVGRDADLFPVFMGNTELIRGYTASSLRDHECRVEYDPRSPSGCPELDQLIGSKIAVANIELRFPLTRSLVLGLLPIGLPPIEGAVFFDAGVAWDENSSVVWNRQPGDNILEVRAPLKSWGASIRTNLLGFLILRFDYTKPLDRSREQSYWTVSFGPTF